MIPSRNNLWYSNKYLNFNAEFIHNKNHILSKINDEFDKYFNDLSYDCIIFYEYSTPTALYYIFKSIAMKRKYILNCDGSLLEKRSLINNMVKRYIFSRAKGFLCGGKAARQYFLNLGANHKLIKIINFTSLFKHDIVKSAATVDEKQVLRKV